MPTYPVAPIFGISNSCNKMTLENGEVMSSIVLYRNLLKLELIEVAIAHTLRFLSLNLSAFGN